ncbi:MAG TPA: glycosyltransferase family 2 protein [Pseudonocardiaceae bacterium]|nr:glycosyltransferase family 2 protein [Pseudonocardiaceae bacterium]
MTPIANRSDGLPPQGTVLTPEQWRSRTLSIVIPALNERVNMPKVMATVPAEALAAVGCQVEVIVVDNGSTDGTGEVAAELGATVVLQPTRGYGHAYHAGFAASSGDLIATGDADCTYPFDALPDMLTTFIDRQLHFMSTNRLGRQNSHAMKPSHVFGNRVLTGVSRSFFRAPFRDSQSGMWLFRREIWADLDVRSGGMPFSQEIKNEAYLKGLRCAEIPIEYRVRGGDVKLNAVKDGLRNLGQLVGHRLRTRRSPLAGQGVHGSHAPEISWESAFDEGTG